MGARQGDLFSDFATRGSTKSRAGSSELLRFRRAKIVILFSALWSALIIGRLYQLQIAQHSVWQGAATKQHVATHTLTAERGTIYDRNGRILATSVPGGSVFVRPHQVNNVDHAIETVSSMLDLPPSMVESKFSNSSPFVWIARQIPRPIADQIDELDIKGVGSLLEPRRYYPYGNAASTLLGTVGVDGNGLSGIEAIYEKALQMPSQNDSVIRDGFGNFMNVSNQHQALPKGKNLTLTLDASLQLIVDEELEKGRLDANAARAMAVLIEADSGDILAMSQSPSPNFNNDAITSKEILKNHVIEAVYEPGSIMKPIVAALALEHEVTHFHELIDCENGAFRYGGHTINDVHASSRLSTYNVVVHSSNIGMTKLGDRLGKDRIYDGLKKFGFGSSTKLGLPGESGGLLRNPKKWYPIDIATHSFGQGIAVTPLQVVRAVSAIANGGILPELSLIHEPGRGGGTRILSEKIAEQAKRMMIGVVDDEGGTGSRARVPGVVIGGKTGTAQRPREDGRGYEKDAYVASFVGFADGRSLGINKKLTLLVVMDRPNTTSIYGGVLSAPVFQKIIHRSLHFLSTQNRRSGIQQPQRSYRGEEVLPDFGTPGMFHRVSYRP